MVKEIIKQITGEIEGWLKTAGVENPVVVLERAAESAFGEYSTNVAMRYARELSKNPLELAESLTTFLNEQTIDGLEKVEFVKPGFINFFFTVEAKTSQLTNIQTLGDNFGKNENLQGEKWVIEHTSPNPNKAMHLGHLRNNLVGMSIVHLLKASGADVTSDAVYNNRGIAIAKVMYGYLANMKKSEEVPTDITYWQEHKTEWFTPEEKDLKPDVFVTECYILGEKSVQSDKAVEELVRQLVVDWEADDKAVWELWQYVLDIAYTGMERTLARLGNQWDKVWFEHEHYAKGKEYVQQGLEKGVFQTLEDGAVLTNLAEEYNLSDTILLKNDGTSLYITQDLALTDLKKKTYDADRLVWVIGPEQTLALKQLFAVCEQLGIGAMSDFTHVSFGYVGLKDKGGAFKKMSSRGGTVVLIDDVIDTVRAAIKARFEAEEKHDESTRESLSETLALAALKFAFLKSDRNQSMAFDIKQSVDIHGDSGMYVMYAYVRTQSILRKANVTGVVEFEPRTELGDEAELVRSLLYFNDVVAKSTKDLSVHHVAQYLLEISSEFNSWYAKETIIDGSEKEAYRLALVSSVGVTIKNALALLGIKTVSEM